MTDTQDRLDGLPIRARLEDMLGKWRRSIELDLRVSAPGTVLAYDPATQRAQVVLGLLPVAVVEGEEIPQGAIVIPTARVAWPGGSLGYVTTPLVPGDTGKVTFTDRCLTHWLLTGGSVDPVNGRTHALADAVFEPGLRTDPGVITPPTDLTATVVEGPLVKLGRAATEFGLLGTTLAATAATIRGVLNIVPNAVEPTAPSAATLANANKAAILALLQAIADALSVKVQIE